MARGRVVHAKRRSVKQWFGTSDQGAQTVASGAKVLIQILVPGEAMTIIRNRGILIVAPQSGATDTTSDGVYGIGVVSDVAAALGVTGIPGPFTESGWGGWMVHQFWRMQLDVTTDVGRLGGTGFQVSYDIDSKAMRKIGPNERMVEVFESRSGAVFTVAHVRTLVLTS